MENKETLKLVMANIAAGFISTGQLYRNDNKYFFEDEQLKSMYDIACQICDACDKNYENDPTRKQA